MNKNDGGLTAKDAEARRGNDDHDHDGFHHKDTKARRTTTMIIEVVKSTALNNIGEAAFELFEGKQAYE